MLAAWRRTSPRASVPERMALMLSEAAVSITITSLTDILSFFIGIISPFQSVRIFCMYSGKSEKYKIHYIKNIEFSLRNTLEMSIFRNKIQNTLKISIYRYKIQNTLKMSIFDTKYKTHSKLVFSIQNAFKMSIFYSKYIRNEYLPYKIQNTLEMSIFETKYKAH